MVLAFCKRLFYVLSAAICLMLAGTPARAFQSASTVLISDPTVGVPYGPLTVLQGWRGEAHMDRTSDPLSVGGATTAADLRSPDGSASFQALAVPFHTMNIPQSQSRAARGNPGAQRNAYLGRFTSTTELMTRVILPSLGVKDQPVKVESWPRDKLMAKLNEAQQHGEVRPIADGASVLLRRNGREFLILGETYGSNAGGSTMREPENTVTYLSIWSAPVGKTEALAQAADRLARSDGSPAWQRANQQYLMEWEQEMRRDAGHAIGIYQQSIANSIAVGNANIAEMHRRGEERDRQFALHEQQVTDAGALFRGYLSGEGASYKWCGDGGVRYTVNDHASPGPGYRRCD